jgi:Ca2+-binding RTX toxin-like protein
LACVTEFRKSIGYFDILRNNLEYFFADGKNTLSNSGSANGKALVVGFVNFFKMDLIMATVTTRPDFSTTMPDVSASGINLLKHITATTIWAESSLQYFLGDASSLQLDSEFAAMFSSIYGKATPDATFAFTKLTQNAFSSIDAVTALSFSQTDTASEAEEVIVSVSVPKSTTEGFFQFPGEFYQGSSTNSWSIGAFNSGLDAMQAKAETGGGQYANWTIIHEIGHSLGLKHTHAESTGDALASVGKYMDNEMYSVMSYKAASAGYAYGHAVSMMALDVAALQALYGADTNAAGKSTYTLLDAKGGTLDLTEGSVSIGRAYYCIWDSGGTDTIRYGNTSNSVLINLNDATLNTAQDSSVLRALFTELKQSSYYDALSSALQQEIVDKWHHAGGFFSHVLTSAASGYKAIAGGFSIAHDANIENAIGGASGDLLIGNELANTIRGLAGNDTILGSAGGDSLSGGGGNDRLDGGTGDDVLIGGAGADRFVFSTGYGIDEITDFSHKDIIDLTHLVGVSSFAELKSDMAQYKGSTYILVGDDTLVIDHVTKAELTAADFAI